MTAGSSHTPEFLKPAFIIGVTGHIDLDPADRDRIKADVRRIFSWLRTPPDEDGKSNSDPVLGPGLGLSNTPIILLSSLAPGADQWVAEVAQETEPSIRVLAPLPFFKEQYLQASTFKRDGITKDEKTFLAKFPDEDVFLVRLLDETDLDDTTLRTRHQSILTGSEGQKERDRRYAAAGEYVALNSNILIALTDQPVGRTEGRVRAAGEPAGARAVAELKRRGVRPGLPPILPGLSWVDSGPVIHVYAPRRPKEAASPGNKPFFPEGESLEMLYPYDCRPPEIGEGEDDNPAWRKAGHSILKTLAEHLERLNTEAIRVDPARERGSFAEMLPAADLLQGQRRKPALARASEDLVLSLDRLARLRRRIGDYSAYYNAHLSRLKGLLFSLGFSAAFFFSLADNWDAKIGASWLPQTFFVIAFGFTLATWFAYFRFKKTAAAERCDDYRAVTEGLRVQFYWTACGSGESVASNYLQRQRGELGWIRHVISVSNLPYEPNRVRFHRLPLSDQLAALRSIRDAWIGGQSTYFRKKLEDLTLRQETFTTYAHVLLWTGIVLFVFLVFFTQGTNPVFLSRPLCLICVVTGIVLLAVLYCLAYFRRRAGSASSVASKKERPRSHKRETLVVDCLLVIAFTLLIIGTVYLLEGVAPWLPSANKLGSIFKYLALAGGVLCGAWVEVNFFAENIRQYASMASLFQAAALRFDDCFAWPEQATEDQKEIAQRQVVTSLQSLIVAVGREALSENGEWLIIHRARPLEPVSV